MGGTCYIRLFIYAVARHAKRVHWHLDTGMIILKSDRASPVSPFPYFDWQLFKYLYA